MSENNTNKPETIFADGTWVRSHQFQDGGEILKLSILVDKFSDFIKKHKKSDGFVNLVISRKKTPDDKSSHTVKLDTWVKSGNASPVAQSKPTVKKAAPAQETDEDNMF